MQYVLLRECMLVRKLFYAICDLDTTLVALDSVEVIGGFGIC